MDRVLPFVIIVSVSVVVMILIVTAGWKIYWSAFRPLLQALSGIH